MRSWMRSMTLAVAHPPCASLAASSTIRPCAAAALWESMTVMCRSERYARARAAPSIAAAYVVLSSAEMVTQTISLETAPARSNASKKAAGVGADVVGG